MEVGHSLLGPLRGYMELENNDEILLAFLYAVEKYYWPRNPYHMAAHGANTAHMAVSFLRTLSIWDMCIDLEKIAIIVAALGHDVAHPGRTNNYYINGNGILALIQSDQAVLEAAHCFILQGLIQSS